MQEHPLSLREQICSQYLLLTFLLKQVERFHVRFLKMKSTVSLKKYGEAAKRAQIAGFDTVEIHGGHSYLLSQFLSPITNKRTDEFGGSLENRARFTQLVIEEVRNQVGPFFPIFLRVSADEFMESENTLADYLEYLKCLEKEVDVFDVSCGLNGSIQYQIDANHFPDGWRSYMTKAVKERFGKY